MRVIYLVLVPLLVALAGCDNDLGQPATGSPFQGVTEDYEQAETAISVARIGGASSSYGYDVVTVAFNDRTQDPTNPKIEYAVDDNDPTIVHRTVHHGASLMG